MPKQVPRAGAQRMHNLFNTEIAEISISYSTNVRAMDRVKVVTSQAAFEIFSAVWPSFEHIEYAYVMLLNRSNRLLGVKQLSMGGISGTVIDPKIVFQTALKANASCIILAHNHPSGEIVPSEQDNSLTAKLKSAGEFLDLPLLDHLILTQDKYFSYKDEGRIL